VAVTPEQSTAVQLGLRGSPEHFAASQGFEDMARYGLISADQAAEEKGRNLIETGFNPALAATMAYPFQIADELFDPADQGWRGIPDALSQATANLRGIGSVVGERIKENPFGFLPAIFSSQKTQEPFLPTEQELSDREAFGDPRGTISRSIGEMLMNPLGGMVNVGIGSPRLPIEQWGREHYERSGQAEIESGLRPDIDFGGSYEDYVSSQPDLVQAYEATIPGQLAPIKGGGFTRAALKAIYPELERQRNMLDALVAGGDLRAPTGYRSSVPYEGNVPGHGFGADMYGYQAGMKAALAEDRGGLAPALYRMYQIGKDEDPRLTEIKESEAARALEAYEAGQEMDYTAPKVSFSDLGRQALDFFVPPANASIARDVEFEREPGPEPTWFPATTSSGIGEQGWRPDLPVRTPGGPEVGVETPEQIMASNVAQALATQTPRGMPGSARVTPELQALVELAQTDPTIAERYTTPGSQDLIDIATQQESFSAIRDRVAEQQRQQEQVRADNQRRAQESARAAENARSAREEAQRSADRAAAAAAKSRSAQASRQAAATAKRAKKAAEKERQATIQRQEDQRRRQATERAAAAQRREQAAREREAEARRQQQSRAQAAAAAARARSQAAARARNIAAENRLRSTMGGTNYAAYLRRGK